MNARNIFGAAKPGALAAVALVVGLVAGYFAGREHVKYELRSAFQDAASGLTKGLSNALGSKESKSSQVRASATPTMSYPITATLVKKGWHEGQYGRSEVTFIVAFANGTGKDVRAFDGVLKFTDLLGNQVFGAKLAVNDPVSAGKSLQWEGKLDYNQFISSHESLRNSEPQNLKVEFSLRKVLFDGGETKEY